MRSRAAVHASKPFALAGVMPIVAEILASSRGSDKPCLT